MSRSRSGRVSASLIALAALALLARPGPAGADLAEWKQDRVTAIAKELSESARTLRDTLRSEPPPTLGQGGRMAFYELKEEVGAIESASRRLSRALERGAGREETYPTYRRMMLSVRNAVEEARKANLSEIVLEKITPVGDALRRIRPYYEEEPPV